jgi:flagellin FlaB
MISFNNNDNGFTGLEAAIVLIAFVVVAAVFSYVVLGAGFFTTQKSQEVVHTGVSQASSTLQVVGNVYGTGTTASIVAINFSVSLAPGGTPVDFEKMSMTYSTGTGVETLLRNPTVAPATSDCIAGQWCIIAVQNGATTDWLLEKNEQFDIEAMPTTALGANTDFNLEIKPIVGASLGIKRSTPAALQPVNILY